MKNLALLARCTAAGLLIVAGSVSGQSNQAPGQVIIDLNQIAQQHIGGAPFEQARSYAMVHIAIADAVIAIEGRFQPFHVTVQSPGGASPRAAAAQAAHDVLVALVPENAEDLDAALMASLANIPPGPRASGQQVGRNAARKVLEWRATDGFENANPQPPSFLASMLPGIWRETVSGPAQYSALGAVTPFGLLTPTQFLPPPPPQLESPEYAADFNDVKEKGRATASTRTAEEDRFAHLFAGAQGPFFNVTNPFRLWHNVAADVATDEQLSLIRTARLFALLTASMHDSLQTSQTSKFIYRLWRPETAIAAADIDDNPDTISEVGWMPLLVTPPYPSHASNMSCIGAGAAQMLANVFGTDTKPFTATWFSDSVPPEVVHEQQYNSFFALAQDEGSSRVWGGIHFRFEIDASEQTCSQVANYIFENYMQQRRHQ